MGMEKQQNMDNMGTCDSMTTVTMKDFTAGMEYPDPPPSYKTAGGKSTAVQMTKIVAFAAILIAGMISFSLIFSAWITATANKDCQPTKQHLNTAESLFEPELLRSALLAARDLDFSESKQANQVESKQKDKETSSEEESDEKDEPDDAMTLFKLPLQLNLHDYMFDKSQNQRARMNCVVEKKKSEEVVDEKAKLLPPFFFGRNMTTDPRYLKFTGEKMAISCGHDEEQPQTNHHQAPRVFTDSLEGTQLHPFLLPPPPRNSNPTASGNVPLLIGPIPLGPHIHPIQELLNELGGGVTGGQAFAMEDITPMFIPQTQQDGGSLSQLLNLPQPQSQFKLSRQPFEETSQSFQSEVPLLVQTSDVRERALHHPINIVPRHHFPHVIRPRSTDEKEPRRTKRCACDCACKN